MSFLYSINFFCDIISFLPTIFTFFVFARHFFLFFHFSLWTEGGGGGFWYFYPFFASLFHLVLVILSSFSSILFLPQRLVVICFEIFILFILIFWNLISAPEFWNFYSSRLISFRPFFFFFFSNCISCMRVNPVIHGRWRKEENYIFKKKNKERGTKYASLEKIKFYILFCEMVISNPRGHLKKLSLRYFWENCASWWS